MKVTRLEVKDFNQFRQLNLDLTYPAGHAKAGKPLDKVCIIGQSGTGKTTLLKFIYGLGLETPKYNIDLTQLNDKISLTKEIENIRIVNTLTPKNNVIDYNESYEQINRNVPQSVEDTIDQYVALTENIKLQLLYFPADMKYENELITGTQFNNKKIYDFSEKNHCRNMEYVIKPGKICSGRGTNSDTKIANLATKTGFGNGQLNEAIEELQYKQLSNPRSIVNIAKNCLDPLLENFNLKVKTELDIQKKEDIGVLKIIDRTGNVIPDFLLSTGTKQLILCALPLYLLNPSQTLILYDEPERSLYPDLQKMIVDYYTSFSHDSQFFFATHSPIVASCFEPWEIVELKFDDEGYVIQEPYFSGERHIDNFTKNPKYMTYDMILKEVFDINEPYNEERTQKITEFLSYRTRLEYLKGKNETKSAEYKELFDNYIKAGKDLSWEVNTNKVA